MITVVKAAGATIANGVLSFWYQGADGTLADVAAVSMQILAEDGTTSVLAKTALNVTDAPGSNRKGTGHYAGVWDSSAATAGMFVVRWFYKAESTDAEQSFDLPFELVAAAYPFGPHYCTIKSLRDEGLPGPSGSGAISDVQAQAAIVSASRYIEHFTGRSFEAIYKTVSVDGTGARALLFDEPICAFEVANIKDPLGAVALVDDTLRVYNRHLTDNLRSPDDRDSPKLEYIHGSDLGGVNEYRGGPRSYLRELTWPRGRQNVDVTGLFGYTEPDGSFIGGTPALIQEATRKLVFRNRGPLINRGGSPTTAIIMEATRDQQVQYAQPGAGGDNRARAFTGDPEIDMILVGFQRGPYFGAA
jgi:hypothetical protein